jgi:PHD/YefM family antitoxin component YafN of YafNO toxin-antitoxin module
MEVRFMTVTNAKAILTALVAEVEETGVPLCITRNGIPAVILRKVREGEILLAGEETPTGAETTKRRKPRGKG